MKRTLFNPFMLVAQGFVLGAVLFFATSAPESDAAKQQSAASASVSRTA